VLLGKQGAGKGTQAARLGEHFGLAHLSTGDMFRNQAAYGTAFGLEAKRYMDEGELVPDEITLGLVEECLAPGGPLNDGFVLDGFPRNLHQAEELDRVIGAHALDLAISLEVPCAIVLDRLPGAGVRELPARTTSTCHRPSTGPATRVAAGWSSATTTPKKIVRRLEVYEEQTVPIIDYYRERGMLAQVSGVGDGDDVFERLVKVVEAIPCRTTK
jgi:adenylate kinase